MKVSFWVEPVQAQSSRFSAALSKELRSFAEDLADRPLLTPGTACPSTLHNPVSDVLQVANEAIATGNWTCCESLFEALGTQKKSLTAVQNLQLLLVHAAYYNARQRYDTAKAAALDVRSMASQMNRTEEKAETLLVLSDAGLHTRDIPTAYRWADTALQLSRELGDRQLEGRALMQMGLCTRRNFTAYAQRSFPYYQGAAAAAEAVGDSLTLFFSQIYTAVDYFELNDPQTALPFLRKAMDMVQNIQDLRAAYISYVALGYALDQNGLSKESLPMYRQALLLTSWADLPYSRQNTYTFIGNVFLKQKQFDSALVYANLVSTVQGVDSFYSNSWDLKANIYREAGAYKSAADAFAKAMDWETENSLYRSQNQLNSYEAALQTKEKELQVEHEKKRSIRLQWIAIGAGVLLLFALLAYLAQRRTQKKLAVQNSLIEAQRAELETSLSEKEILLKEIHHRVKNNLMMINSLLELQADSTGSSEAKEAIIEGQNRIRSIALLHQRLYQQADLAVVDFGGFAADLVKEVLNVLRQPAQKIATDIQVPQTLLDIDTAVPVGLILNELLTNSFKHAFAGMREGVITVRLHSPTAGNYQLVYADNGPGLQSGFSFGKDTSLGLRLVYRLAKQLSGKVNYSSEDHCFIIHFKDAVTRNNEA